MKTLDQIVKYLSWATIAALIVLAGCRHAGCCCPPDWFQTWAVPILTAGAVGYLTNWIAIWLLFKPYEKHWGFIQGVIPRNRARMGRELGIVIPEYLLKPDELADQLGILVRDYLQNPELLEDIRSKVNVFLKKYSGSIAAILIPYIEDALKTAIRENLTQEKLGDLYDAVVMKYLGNDANRKFIAGAITDELQARAPEITAAVRNNVRTGVQAYVHAEHPVLSGLFSADEFAGKMVDWLNWDRIGDQIEEKLGEETTRDAIAGELVSLTLKLQRYLKSPEAAEKLGAFLSENREKAEAFVREYLTTHIPGMVDSWLRRDEFWDTVEHKLLPLVQSFILHRLKHEKDSIILKLDLPGKIENSVSNMDVGELHRMILRAADNNLTVIQLLGYALGALAGLLLIFAE